MSAPDALPDGAVERLFWALPDDPVSRMHVIDAIAPAVAALVREAFEAGRESVGLGDLLPNPCDDEEPAPTWYIADSYGEWLRCGLRRGHEGRHEHSDSGLKWANR